MDLVEQVYEALAKDTKLTELLADGKEGIRADLTSYSGRYPVLCYQVISDVPHLFGDDLELARRVTVQISVLTRNGSDSEIVLRVQKNHEFPGVDQGEYKQNYGWQDKSCYPSVYCSGG